MKTNCRKSSLGYLIFIARQRAQTYPKAFCTAFQSLTPESNRRRFGKLHTLNDWSSCQFRNTAVPSINVSILRNTKTPDRLANALSVMARRKDRYPRTNGSETPMCEMRSWSCPMNWKRQITLSTAAVIILTESTVFKWDHERVWDGWFVIPIPADSTSYKVQSTFGSTSNSYRLSHPPNSH